jgi:WD40 repeat protein
MRPDRLFVAVLLWLSAALGVPAQELLERGTFQAQKFRVQRAALSPDGKVLAALGGNTRGGELKLWDVATGKEIASFPGQMSSLESLAFSADGKRLASGGHGTLHVWDANAHKEIAVFKGLHLGVTVVALNQDGTRLAAVEWNEAKLWDVASGKELASFRHHVPVSGWVGAAISRDLATLAVHNYQEIDLWDTATGKEKATLSEHRGEVGCMLWSADDKVLIASSTRYYGRNVPWKGDVKLWDVASGKERATLPGPFGRVLAMAASLDSKTLALLDSPELHAEADVKLVDVDTGRERVLRVPPQCSFLSLHFTPEGKLMVTGTSVDALRLWEVSLPKRDRRP